VGEDEDSQIRDSIPGTNSREKKVRPSRIEKKNESLKPTTPQTGTRGSSEKCRERKEEGFGNRKSREKK